MSFLSSAPVLFVTIIVSLFHQCGAQNNNTIAEDPLAFANPNYNLTTINIAYQVWAGCGPPENLTTVRRRVSYVVVNDLAIVDGDVIYGTEDDILEDMVRDDDTPTKRSLSERAPALRWPSAIIPYSWSSEDVSAWLSDSGKEDRKQVFRDAAKVWMDRLPWLQIVEKTDAYDVNGNGLPDRITISFIEGGVSWSPLGRASRQQWSVIGLGSSWLSTYVHELGHSIGLHHEQKRPDRNKYFDLDCSKIAGDVPPVCTSATDCEGWGCQFAPLSDPAIYNFEGPYDTSSIMHYFEGAFAKDPALPPMTGIAPGVFVGRTDKPTLLDLIRVCEMYQPQCHGRGICGDGILSPSNGEECDPGCGKNDSCTEDCKLKPVCGNSIVEADEECDDGPTGSASCTSDCKKVTCLQTCDPDPRKNGCDITTSCIKVEGSSAMNVGKHYCACRHGFRAELGAPQMRLPWYTPISQEGRVFVEPGRSCNILCDDYALGKDGCKEVDEQPKCY